MQFQITGLVIDWQDDYDFIQPISPAERVRITEEIIGSIWDADDEDELVNEITAAHGWSIESIDYAHVLRPYP
ncbi:MAG: hypothetical protein EB168_07360 [Euryarchaeota archaeon]|nr:hypothetical protein [Euryarchaeota archaeon]